jgi:hypothetical protein
MHKEDDPLRLALNCTGSLPYFMVRHITAMMSPTVELSEHDIANSKALIQKLNSINQQNMDILVSSHGLSLFTKVPPKETVSAGYAFQ